MYKYLEINNMQICFSLLLPISNIPLQIGKCTLGGKCTPGLETLHQTFWDVMELESSQFDEQMLSNEMEGNLMKCSKNVELHQPNPSSCVCSTHKMLMCAIRSQSHLIRNIVQALKLQPFK